jgi:puromycin-sensitive aminopeptidase
VRFVSESGTNPQPSHRLPKGIVPRRYALDITPELTAATFRCLADIAVDIGEPSSAITLNSIDLDWTAVWIVDAFGVRHEATWTFALDVEQATITVSDPIVGAVTIHIECTGILTDTLKGFYRSIAVHPDGSEHIIGSTQCQATDARRIFPCWDEPEFKAVFAITMAIEPHLTAVSNWPEVERTSRGELVAVRFDDTMVMSTYLVAWCVGELEITEVRNVAGVALRVVHVPGKGHLTQFALDCAAFALEFFADYYAIGVPCPKVDLIAVPDFAAGAMENPGCITFREVLLLVDPDNSTQSEQRLVADVVVHELAHLWFGDLVTMKWWNGIWLNEAFATFMEVMGVDAWRPDWNRWEHFGLERAVAMATDSLISTRPIEFEVVTPSDADGMFDVITYQKGGAVLRMLEQWLTPTVFRDGVRRYLTKHAYGSTEVTDLWDALEAQSGQPVRQVMDAWIWQPGYPLVMAVHDDGDAVLTQRRFSLSDTPPSWWPIPVLSAVIDGDGATQSTLLEQAPHRIAVGANALRANAGGHGVYRVRYDDELTHRLLSQLDSLDALERFGLVDDGWAAVLADHLDADQWLTMVEQFGGENELAVWQNIIGGLGWCSRVVHEVDRSAFEQRAAALLHQPLSRLGLTVRSGDDDITRELRGALIGALGTIGNDVAIIEYCRSVEADQPTSDAAISAAALTVSAAHGDPATFDHIVNRFRNASAPQEQIRYLYALADLPQAESMTRTIELAFNEVRPQDAPFLLRRCLDHRLLGPMVWGVVSRRWSEACERFPANSLVRLAGGITTLMTIELRDDVEAFFGTHPLDQSMGTLRQHLERQRVNVALMQRAGDQLARTLRP